MYSKYFKITWVHPVLVFLAMVLDGAIALNAASILYRLPMAASPYLVLLFLLAPTLVGSEGIKNPSDQYLLAFTVGLVYDLYYTGYVGVSMIGFPMILGIARWVQQFFEHTYFWEMMIFFFVLNCYLLFDYLAFSIINVAQQNIQEFVIFHMFPTVLLNILLFMLFYPIIEWLYALMRGAEMIDYNVTNQQIGNRMIIKRRADRFKN